MADTRTAFGHRVEATDNDNTMGGAILEIEKGKKTDMVFHTRVRKLLYVIAGKLHITVLADGKTAKIEASAGHSFVVRCGLAYQLEGAEKSIVVEFSDLWDTKDTHCIVKGSAEELPTKQSEIDTKPQPPSDQVAREAEIQQRPKKGKKKKKK